MAAPVPCVPVAAVLGRPSSSLLRKRRFRRRPCVLVAAVLGRPLCPRRGRIWPPPLAPPSHVLLPVPPLPHPPGPLRHESGHRRCPPRRMGIHPSPYHPRPQSYPLPPRHRHRHRHHRPHAGAENRPAPLLPSLRHHRPRNRPHRRPAGAGERRRLHMARPHHRPPPLPPGLRPNQRPPKIRPHRQQSPLLQRHLETHRRRPCHRPSQGRPPRVRHRPLRQYPPLRKRPPRPHLSHRLRLRSDDRRRPQQPPSRPHLRHPHQGR